LRERRHYCWQVLVAVIAQVRPDLSSLSARGAILGNPGPSKFFRQSSSRQDEFSGLDNVMDSVLEAVDRTKRKNDSPLAPPSKIIPGTETFEDLEAFLKRKKSEKMEEMKKKK